MLSLHVLGLHMHWFRVLITLFPKCLSNSPSLLSNNSSCAHRSKAAYVSYANYLLTQYEVK